MAAEAAIDLKFSQCFGEKGAVDDLTDGESSVREKEWKRIRRSAGGGLARTVRHAGTHVDSHVDQRSILMRSSF